MCNVRSNLEKYGISLVSRANRKELAKKILQSDDEQLSEDNRSQTKADKSLKHLQKEKLVQSRKNTWKEYKKKSSNKRAVDFSASDSDDEIKYMSSSELRSSLQREKRKCQKLKLENNELRKLRAEDLLQDLTNIVNTAQADLQNLSNSIHTLLQNVEKHNTRWPSLTKQEDLDNINDLLHITKFESKSDNDENFLTLLDTEDTSNSIQ
ncbi:PREDICTED: uncharacterized protein LOC105461996, partial [Wasmannia auropunctata]|uniref:uncharacterized protein LOC105461996 n=1 Tax=Wasmannia auropunctata TaxID=64793 RepID=UPI0005EEE139